MIEGEGIYIDLKAMRRVLKSEAQFLMEKSDRIAFCTPAIADCTEALVAFEMAYDFPLERSFYARKLKSLCIVLKHDVEDISELRLLKGKSDRTGRTADSINLEIARLMGSIDNGIGKYVKSVLKGKTSADLGGGSL